ncbi:MAG: DUF3298 domain-containing protein [Gammaproteobacteria bacterium]|nr:DUF3298 domain-containing protein [Gammaproteobacteria bacterium]
MRIYRAFAVLVAGTLLTACPAGGTGTRAEAPPVRYALHEHRQESRGCARAGEPCAEVLLRWPRFSPDAAPAAVAAMQAWIADEMARDPLGDGLAASPEAAARAFVAAFEAEAATAPVTEWFLRRQAQLIHQDARVISLAVDSSVYAGGAHPLSSRQLASFDRDTGERLDIEAVVRPEARTLFADLLTRALRRERGIAAGVSLADAGFFLDDDRVPPTDNFAVTADGWLLHYDPYEIAPYALGPVELALAFREIENVARPDTAAAPREPPRILEPR